MDRTFEEALRLSNCCISCRLQLERGCPEVTPLSRACADAGETVNARIGFIFGHYRVMVIERGKAR